MKTSLRLLLLAVFALLFVGTASAHYNPQLGRWLSRDPMGEAGGFNLYAYCGNDPVNRHDPLGLADLYIGYDTHGDAILELSARIVNGTPQVYYWDWAHWWGPMIGGGVNHYWQAPSASELARLFRRTPNGWRLASYSEVWAARNQQFAESFPVAMRNAAETTTAVAKLHYGGLALMTCPLILMEGGLTWGTVAAASHEGYAGLSLLSGAVAGENYATSPEGWMLKQTGAPEWAVIGTDMAAGVGWPFMVGRGPQFRMSSGFEIGEIMPNGQIAGMGPGAAWIGDFFESLIRKIRTPGKFDTPPLASVEEALELARRAFPDAIELPPARAGLPYPKPPKGTKKFFQVHPAEPGTNELPHIKYEDWTRGKKDGGGSWGHIFFKG